MNEPKPSSRRLRWAYVLAPLTIVAVVTGVVALSSTAAESSADVLADVTWAAFVATLFGLPVAYAVQVVLAYGAKRLGHDPSTMSARRILITGTAAGVVLAVVAGLPAFDLSAVVPGALLGLSAALAFVLIRGRPGAPG